MYALWKTGFIKYLSGGLILSVLSLSACGIVDVPNSMQVRSGTEPRYQDDDVRFRTTYYFRSFDYCQADNSKGGNGPPRNDSLYRFKMTGKADSLFNDIVFESGTLKKQEIDPFGANIAFDGKNKRFYFKSSGETKREAACADKNAEIERLKKMYDNVEGGDATSNTLRESLANRMTVLIEDPSCSLTATLASTQRDPKSAIETSGKHLIKAGKLLKDGKQYVANKSVADNLGKFLTDAGSKLQEFGRDNDLSKLSKLFIVSKFKKENQTDDLLGLNGLADRVLGLFLNAQIALDNVSKNVLRVRYNLADAGMKIKEAGNAFSNTGHDHINEYNRLLKELADAPKGQEGNSSSSLKKDTSFSTTSMGALAPSPIPTPKPPVNVTKIEWGGAVPAATVHPTPVAKAPPFSVYKAQVVLPKLSGVDTPIQEKADTAKATGDWLISIGQELAKAGNMLKNVGDDNVASGGAKEACPFDRPTKRGFQVLGPEGWRTFDQDERLIMAMSAKATPLIGMLKTVSARVLNEQPSQAEALLALVRARAKVERALFHFGGTGDADNIEVKDKIEALAKAFKIEKIVGLGKKGVAK